MTKPSRLTSKDWLQAGFVALAERGPEGLKAEPLARQIGSTKGSFYWHFKDVSHFKRSMLDYWQQAGFTDIVDFLEGEPSIPKRLRLLGQIAANAAWPGYDGAPIEPAIRAWSRADDMVAGVVQRVDAKRLEYLARMFGELGLTNPDFARIVYGALIGLEDLSSRDRAGRSDPLGTLIDLILALNTRDAAP